MADYEVRIIEQDNHRFGEEREAIALLGFTRHGFNMNGTMAVSCDTCGVMFTPDIPRHLRAHRRQCGWDNGSPAVGVTAEEKP
jgi:hypothetical protein